jgi:glycosyltransferase involved in cell wall biosynthesis
MSGTEVETPLVVNVVTRLNVGGISRHLEIVSTRMGGYNGVLITGRPEAREGSMLEEIAGRGARIEVAPGLRRRIDPLADLRAFLWLRRWFRRHRPAIVVTHMAKAGALGRLAAVAAGVPIRVHVFHGHVLQGYFDPTRNLAFRLAETFLGLFTTRFVAVSPEIAAAVSALGIGRDRFDVIPYGLDLGPLDAGSRGSLRAELCIPEGAPTVGIVGRLVPIKDHRMFLAAAAAVGREIGDAHFLVVGDGELRAELEALAAGMEISPRVHFTGWRSDLSDIYAGLDVAVCCSRNEGAPMAIIEACAAGLPVAATRVGGIPDIISNGLNGYLVESGDWSALAAAVRSILSSPERGRAMGARGRDLVLQRFGTERLVLDLRQLYARLLREHAPSTRATA